MNSACWPLAVCSITHGAILFAGTGGPGGPPWLIGGEEPIAPNAAMAAAAKVNEQNKRRHGTSVPARASPKNRPMRTGRRLKTRRARETDFVSKMELSWRMPFYPGSRLHVKHFGIFGPRIPPLQKAANYSGRDETPARGKNWTQSAAHINIVVQVIERCSPGAGVVEHIVRLAIAIEIGRSHQLIADCDRWPKGAADIHPSRQIIDPTLTRAGVEEGIVRLPVPIKIRYTG